MPRSRALPPPLSRLIVWSGIGAMAWMTAGCGDRSAPSDRADAGDPTPYEPSVPVYHSFPDATFVGAESCRTCHPGEFNDWLQSDHHKAMLPATDESVKGDFNDVTFTHFGRTWRFFRKGSEFWVNAEDADGTRKDFKVDYTFGIHPLQQYLIPYPGGRYQALQVCWDTRPAEEGGQRWYHLYPDEEIPPDDILHWTRPHFNWNYMCADCHSTDLKKNHDPVTNTYATTWAEINVSCEACHGPASEHVKWAQAHQAAGGTAASGADLSGLKKYLGNKGLVVTLKEPEEAGWAINPATGQPQRTAPLNSTVQVDTCARCHSHRQLLEPHHVAGQSYLDTHLPSILSDQLYHHDGQVDEEVYVYGSFVQSKMYHAGVRCTDCHHPHTMKPLAAGNALCVRCHVPEKYDSPAHHFHLPQSTGAQCVECHMPTKNYMVVDARRDHSLRIPRPDLTKKLGSPNACNQCHADKDTDWAIAAYEKWWGKGPRNAHFGEILAAARAAQPGSLEKLVDLANDLDRPGIVRATALSEIGRQNFHQDTLRQAAARLADPEPLVRQEAVALMERQPEPAERLRIVAPLLTDPARAVRIEAARVLAMATSRMTPEQRGAFDRAAVEFKEAQRAISDRAAGHLRLGQFYLDQGLTVEAEAAYRKATEIESDHVPSWVNLAELLFRQNRQTDAEAAFRGAVTHASAPENRGLAHDALARYLIRQKRYDEGLIELQQAARLLPQDARVHYFLGVAYHSLGRFEDALGPLKKATELAPREPEYLAGLATICRDAGRLDEALAAAEKLLQLNPSDPQAGQLVQQIRAMSQ
ncbi:MAG: tetratricopeptide repeat protein [Verrucomicrobiales bacterium]|nr:tetratricopeptide repeat protein [Verrucomicrobiales bacterium]